MSDSGERRTEGEERRGEARRGEASRDEKGRGEARRGEARRGEERRGEERRGEESVGNWLIVSDFESYCIRELVCLFSCLECRFSQSAFVYSRCAVDKRLLDCSFSSTEGILYERKNL